MKLCPQCAFIYEDEQRVCDMDGTALVHGPTLAVVEPLSAPSRLTIDLPATPASQRVASRSRRLPVLVLLFVVLAMLLSVFVFAQVRRSRSSHAVRSPQPMRSAAPDNTPQLSSSERVSSASVEVAPAPQQSQQDSTPPNVAVTAALTRAHLATSPISARAASENKASSVLVRLKNGAAINADEVWERKEGFWYRQAGMVTFLKRSQVRAIERVTPTRVFPKTVAGSNENPNRKSDNRAAPNQLRIPRLEAVDSKKPSRVKSFLKLTGRILKKPFKL